MWSKNFVNCLICGTTKRPYMGKGKCSFCYLKEYRKDPENNRKSREHKKIWYIQNVTSEQQRITREQRHFDGNREIALKRDKWVCQSCGENKISRLTVHHIDGNGRGKINPNNSLENLKTLCRSCHAKIHGKIKQWAKHYTHCISCGTTNKKHNAKGLCWECYKKSK